MSEVGVAYVRLVPSMAGFSSKASKGMQSGLAGPASAAGQTAGANAGQGFVAGFGDSLQRGGKALSGFGDKLTLGLTLPLVAAGAKATGFASDLNESINATRVVFGNASTVIDRFARDSATSMGLSERAFREAVVPIGSMMQNLGFSQREAAGWSGILAQRAADMASVFNTDVDEALQAIQAGLRGEADPLERFGVGLSMAAVQAKAMEMGLADTASELTDNQVQQARLALLMEQTDDIAGDFANTSTDVANAERIAAAEAENAAAQFGQNLLPIKKQLIDVASGLIDRFNQLSPAQQDIALKAGIAAAALGPVLSVTGRLTTGIGTMVKGFAAVGRGSAKVAKGGVKGARGLGRLASGFRDARAAESAFSGRLGTLGGKLRTGVNAVGRFGAATARGTARAAASFGRLAASAATASGRVAASFATMAGRAAAATGRVVAQIGIQVARWAFLGVQSLLNAAKVAAAWLISLGPIAIVGAAVAGLVALIIANWDKVVGATKAAFGFVTGLIGGAINWVKTNWPTLLAVLTGPIGLAVLLIAKNWQSIKDGASAVKNWIVGRFNDVVGFVTGLPGRISRAASGMWDGIKNAFRSTINTVIGWWNRISFTLPTIEIPGFDPPGPGPSFGGATIGGQTFSTPNIPMLARGGIVTAPTLVMAGEGGEDEAIVSLDKLDDMIRAASADELTAHAPPRAVAASRDLELRFTGADGAFATAFQKLVRIGGIQLYADGRPVRVNKGR